MRSDMAEAASQFDPINIPIKSYQFLFEIITNPIKHLYKTIKFLSTSNQNPINILTHPVKPLPKPIKFLSCAFKIRSTTIKILST